MKLGIVAVGRLKSGPERELVERYRTRADGLSRTLGLSAIDAIELPEGRERHAADRQKSEAASIVARTAGHLLVAIDERGSALTSEEFAARLGAWRDGGRAVVSLVIGGPDGLAEDVRAKADLVLSFGRMTLPHQIVRALVFEQLYRALTILSGHPYHRGA